jgi:hypothetical protein
MKAECDWLLLRSELPKAHRLHAGAARRMGNFLMMAFPWNRVRSFTSGSLSLPVHLLSYGLRLTIQLNETCLHHSTSHDSWTIATDIIYLSMTLTYQTNFCFNRKFPPWGTCILPTSFMISQIQLVQSKAWRSLLQPCVSCYSDMMMKTVAVRPKDRFTQHR